MPELVRPYRGVSAQERRADRRARLLTACLDAVGADGVAGTTVGSICARAGLTKRYFYENFGDLSAILSEALDTMFTTLRRRITEALTAGHTDDPLARGVITLRLLVETMDDARVARLYIEAPGHPVLRQLRDQAIEDYTGMLTEHVLGGDPGDAKAMLAARVVVAGITHAVTSWLEGRVPVDREDLIQELARVGVAAAAPARR